MNNSVETLGARLRVLRRRAGLSQRELARRARMSNGAISTIESDKVSPSISALRQILSALDLSLAEFFAHEEPAGEPVVFRVRDLTEIAGGAVSYRQVGADLRGRALQMLHERYRPGARSGSHLLTHQGEEAGLVISGTLALEVDGQSYELGPGDAYRFDSRRPHAFANAGSTDLVIVSACTPPTF